jgi:CHAD domain-containing protein
MKLDAAEWLLHLDHARELALAGEPEGVHQVRVSLRRLRVWLGFHGDRRRLDRELKWAGRALAKLRDLDVFDSVFTAEARQALRVEAEAEALGALQSKRWTALREGLGALEPVKRKRAVRALEKLERRLETLRVAPGDGEALHRRRRTLRRARYAREWLGQKAKDLAAAQEQLGAVCDLLALQRMARQQGIEGPEVLERGIARGFELLGDA